MLDVFDILGKIRPHIDDSIILDDGLSVLADQYKLDIFIVDNIREGQNRHKGSGGDLYCFPIDNYQHGVDLINEISNHLEIGKQSHAFIERNGIALAQSNGIYLFVIKHKKY